MKKGGSKFEENSGTTGYIRTGQVLFDSRHSGDLGHGRTGLPAPHCGAFQSDGVPQLL